MQQGADEKLRDGAERNYQKVMGVYGQVPGGMFGADENVRPGFTDPRQAAETCSMVEFMHSFEMLTRITGQSIWADRCEEVAFNSLPAATTEDLKALHYLTAPNQVICDRLNKSPGVQNGGTMFSYSAGAVYRCCQHNVAMGWPYFAEELWLGTGDEGLCASMYAPCGVRARVRGGQEVSIQEETRYPFEDALALTITMNQPARFPLYLRVPKWCKNPAVRVNGVALNGAGDAQQGYIVLDRLWSNGDRCELQLPMHVEVRRWEKNHNAASVQRGPLTYSLKIGEQWVEYGGARAWPEWEVYPTTAWNYGLVLDNQLWVQAVTEADKNAEPYLPFASAAAPVELRMKARKISSWQADSRGLVAPLKDSPIKSTEPEEFVSLIPMGMARLRISSFPVIGNGADAREWPLVLARASASYENGKDKLEAIYDGIEPKSSNDTKIPRFTWWDHKGTEEWVQYEYDRPREMSGVKVYWFDDAPTKGECRLPAGWLVLCRVNGQWTAPGIDNIDTIVKDGYSTITFDPVQADAIKIVVQLRKGYSAGILEWKVE